MFKKYGIAISILLILAGSMLVGHISDKSTLAPKEAVADYIWRYGGSTKVGYTPEQIIIPKYSWKRDHCKSCSYLVKKIKHWMDAYRKYNNWQIRNVAANMAANYLKLYELNECHRYYRNTSIGPFHLALELEALESE